MLLWQQQLSSILPKITGFASLLGSAAIIVDVVVRKYRKKGNSCSKPTTYHRLMLGMSFCDMIYSSAVMMTTWPIPADTTGTYATYGNDATCKAQAFFMQWAIASPFYTLCLTIYYYLFIVKNSMPSLRIESFMHFICISFPLGTSVAALALDLFGYATFWCWITPAHSTYRMLFYYVPLWVIIVVIAVIMSIIYFSIAKQEARQRKYRFRGGLNNQGENRNNSNGNNPPQGNRNSIRVSDSVKRQSFWYVGSFFIVWSILSVMRVMSAAGRTDPFPFWVTLAGITLVPSQGVFNFWIYIRPRFKRYRKRHPEVGRFKAFFRVNPLFAGCKCCHGSPVGARLTRRLYAANFLHSIRNIRGTHMQTNVANEEWIDDDYNSQEEEESEPEQNGEGESTIELHQPIDVCCLVP